MRSVYSMKEQLVSIKTAKLAKKQGFNIECGYRYYKVYEGSTLNRVGHTAGDFIPSTIKGGDDSLGTAPTAEAPSQSFLQKWLREEKDILVEVTFSSRLSRKLYEAAHEKPSLNFSWKIYTSIKDPSHFFPEFWTDDTFETYEEALEKGLQEALKMVR